MQDYKCLCTAVTICATLFSPKFDSSILISLTSKVGQVPGICCTHVKYTQDPNLVTAGQQVAEIIQIFQWWHKPSKVGQDDLVFGVRFGCTSGSAHIRLLVSVCAPFTICATLVVPKCFLSIVTPMTPRRRSNPRQLLQPCQMHPRCKLGDHRSVACR